MRWQGRRQSGNIEDRRRMGAGRGGPVRVGGVGLIAILVIGYFLGVDVTPLLDDVASQQDGDIRAGGPLSDADRRAGEFVAVTLADTEAIWQDILPEAFGRDYDAPTLVLFKGRTSSPCATASAATGPFYCPIDRKIYLDTAFFVTMNRKLGAGGDFAAAYVVAHEVAHSVQDQLGILAETQAARQQSGTAQANAISVRTELQADCFSGVWARLAEAQLGTIEPGDLDEALNAARQIGDDTLQRNAGQQPMPHTFTHGTSAQRQRWFARGYETGDPNQCDTFAARGL